MKEIKKAIIDQGIQVYVISLLVILAVAVFWALKTPIESRLGDYRWHIDTVERMLVTRAIETPHFLYHLLVILVDAPIPGIETSEAAFVVVLVFQVALAVVIYALIQRAFGNNLMVAALVALALTIVTPITIFTWPDNLYFGYIGINVYHNPTSTILKPLALLLFFYAARIFARQPSQNLIPTIFIVGILTLLSTLAKPSYTIVLLPGLAFLASSRYLQKRVVDWRLMILGIVLPAAAVLYWQIDGFERLEGFLVSSQPRFTISSPIIIAPFDTYSHFSSWLLPKFVLSILFPLSVLLLYFKKATRDTYLSLAWSIFVVGAFYTYFLAEGGPAKFHGNFWWSAQLALLILFVFSTAFLVQQKVRSKRFYICAAVFVLHLISGIVWYDIQLDGSDFATSW